MSQLGEIHLSILTNPYNNLEKSIWGQGMAMIRLVADKDIFAYLQEKPQLNLLWDDLLLLCRPVSSNHFYLPPILSLQADKQTKMFVLL